MALTLLKSDNLRTAEKTKSLPRPDTTVTFQRERFAEIVTELGPLIKEHDKELWPHRKWGPLLLNTVQYLEMEHAGVLFVLTARNEMRELVGYCFEIVLPGSLHYAKTKHSLNDTIYLHHDYREGKGLSVKQSPGFKFLEAREWLLDDLRVERRRMDFKAQRDFGELMVKLGYEYEGPIYQKVVES